VLSVTLMRLMFVHNCRLDALLTVDVAVTAHILLQACCSDCLEQAHTHSLLCSQVCCVNRAVRDALSDM
jgi:hypothetical protein